MITDRPSSAPRVSHRGRLVVGLWIAGLCAGTLAEALGAPLNVVTTIFPLYDWVRVVGGTNVQVTQLLPPGVEAHTYAPSPSDLRKIERAHLFVYIAPTLEPWAERLGQGRCRLWAAISAISPTTWPAHARSAGSVKPHHDRDAADLAQAPKAQRAAAERVREREHEHNRGRTEAEHAHDPTCDHDHSEGEDPHIWVDPLIAADVVRGLARELAQLDPEHREDYSARAEDYVKQLLALHEDFAAFVRSLRSRTILYAGHRAFDLFGARYGVEFVTPYRGFSPEVPPTPVAIATLIERMRRESIRVIFTEEIVEPRVARVLVEQTGARIERLHTLHNRTPEEVRRDETYLSLHRRNLAVLNAALRPDASSSP
jgi:zinc transport system substrate-binding protein